MDITLSGGSDGLAKAGSRKLRLGSKMRYKEDFPTAPWDLFQHVPARLPLQLVWTSRTKTHLSYNRLHNLDEYNQQSCKGVWPSYPHVRSTERVSEEIVDCVLKTISSELLSLVLVLLGAHDTMIRALPCSRSK